MMKCWRPIERVNEGQPTIQIGEDVYALQNATGEEMNAGNACLEQWRVELEYEVMVNEPSLPRPYLDWRRKPQDVPFEELIFCGGECIGVCHDGCIMLFDDPATHRREKFLGEFITGPDRTHIAYDYYYLIKIK